ncbi:MAG: cell surface protein [Proteobacteria bacterium]|nr:cell surface protein [Pseudomonadota bacterium]
MRVSRTLAAVAALSACLAVAACSKSTQDKTGQDLKAVGADTAQAAKDVANAPAAKELGSDIKQGTKEAADKTAEATKEAAAKLKSGADQAGEKLKSGAQQAADKTKDAVDNAKH